MTSVVVVVVCGRLTIPSFSWALTSLPGAEFSCSRARVQRRRLCVVCFIRCVWWPRVREVAPLDDSTAPRPCLVEGRQTTLCVCEVTLPKSWPGKIVYLRDLNRKWAARPSYVTGGCYDRTSADYLVLLCIEYWLNLWFGMGVMFTLIDWVFWVVFGAVIANVRAAIAGAVQWLSQNCQNKRRARYMYIVECILKLAWGWLWDTNPQAVATGTGKILIKSG